MLLADMGAEIIRLERVGADVAGLGLPTKFNLMNRSRPSIAVDLKSDKGRELVLRLCENADAIFEGFRPGVMERLGLGPEDCMARNPRLVYGRITGWGQDGPLAGAAGHDPNYIALAGALGCIGERDGAPVYPLNLIGDMGGGGAYLAMGLLAALLEVSRSGKGQVVDAAMIDGAATLMASTFAANQVGFWSDERGTNLLDSGAHFYEVYETADGKYISLGSIEPQFYAILMEKTGLAGDPDFAQQMNPMKWDELKERMTALILTKTRDEWCAIMDGTDICFAPVLSLNEAPQHPHNISRQTFVETDGIVQPAPVPRFVGTPSDEPTHGDAGLINFEEILECWK